MFYLSIILLFIGFLWLLFAPSKMQDANKRDVYYNVKKFAAVWLVMGLAAFFLASLTVVGTRNVGIPTSFGKTTGNTFGAGMHVKAPWVKVTDVDATIQPEEYHASSCIQVKIADGGDACVSLAYRWRINAEHADVAFADYRKAKDGLLKGIRKAVVSTNVKAAINDVLGTYDPLAGVNITPNMSPEELANLKVNVVPDYNKLDDDIQKDVESKIANLGGLVDIQSVTVSYIRLPESTQKRINAFNAAVQDTKIAVQDIATKTAQASANEKLAASLKDPNVLVAKCLDGLISGDIQNVPGFSCSLGGGSAVVLPSAK